MVRIGVVGFCMCMGSGAEEEKRGGIGGVGHVFGKRGRNTRWGDLLRPRIVQIKTREREREEGWSLLIRGNGWRLFGCHLLALACFYLRMIPLGPLGSLFKKGWRAMVTRERCDVILGNPFTK